MSTGFNPADATPGTATHPGPAATPSILALAGGVGGAKLAHGLALGLPDGALSVVVNTGDDFKLWGLHISPDIDTVMYTLSGLANKAQGWGLEGDTTNGMQMLARYGVDSWFLLGDMDLSTHLLRTYLLTQDRTLTQITSQLSASLGIQTAILPMSDHPVQTFIQTPAGLLDFQTYFVAHRHSDTVTGIVLQGIEDAQPTPEVLAAIAKVQAIIFCPSNPFVSIGPILKVPGLSAALAASGAPVVAISPIVGGTALKGPAATMLASMGYEVSPAGVAAIYQGIIDGMIIDRADESLAPRIQALGIAVEIADTIMVTDDDRRALGQVALHFCEQLASAGRASGRTS
jgi:LPPG:FO 2-phospho-L-lactate transferase